MSLLETMRKMNSNGNVSGSISKACTVISLSELKELLSKKEDNEISILVTGDLHVASRSVDNKKIVDSINRITSSSILEYTDSLIINGDFLDRRVSLASDEASDFILLSLGILARCKKYNVSLDVLEGTPSHDNKQPFIMTLFDTYLKDADKYPLRYIDRVSVLDLLSTKKEQVRKIFGRDLKVLFIPDEVSTDSQVTWGMVKETLTLNSVDKVDMSYLHGTFRYQEPMFTEKSHSEENYESITNGKIIINHWHLPSSKGDKIRAPGSLERLRHGEEETKGFYYCFLSPDGDSVKVREYFVINDEATIFMTINVTGMSLNDVYNLIDVMIVENPDIRLRFELSRLDPLYPSLSEIKSKYRSIKITEKIADSETEKLIDFDSIDNDVTFSIRPDNLLDLVLNKIDDSEDLIKENIKILIGEEDESRTGI